MPNDYRLHVDCAAALHVIHESPSVRCPRMPADIVDLARAKPWTPSLSARCVSLESIGPVRYGDRDCIGQLPSGEWLAFLCNGYTHGPHASRDDALRCCNGTCECWRRADEMRAARRAL